MHAASPQRPTPPKKKKKIPTGLFQWRLFLPPLRRRRRRRRLRPHPLALSRASSRQSLSLPMPQAQ